MISSLTPEIIYEDKDIIVCHKPAGVPTQSSRIGTKDMVSILKNHLKKNTAKKASSREPYIAVIHRLDQPVEGLQITLNGENEAVLTLKSKSIGILDSVKEGYSGRILNEICITFESKDGSYYIQADIVDTSCTIYKINNDTDESEWYFSSDEYKIGLVP